MTDVGICLESLDKRKESRKRSNMLSSHNGVIILGAKDVFWFIILLHKATNIHSKLCLLISGCSAFHIPRY